MAALKSSVEAPEFKILSSDSSKPHNGQTGQQLTSAVNKAASDNASESDVEALLWRLWNAIIATASRTAPAKQQHLSDLLRDIAAQGNIKSGQGSEIKVWDQAVWSELPVFGAAVREVFNDCNTNDKEEQRQWVNINAFLARVTHDNAKAGAGGARDFSLFGIWSLRDAAEGKSDESVPQYKAEAAKAWLEIAGATIERLSAEEKSYDGKRAAPGSGYSDKQWRGYSKDRLEVWTAQLQR